MNIESYGNPAMDALVEWFGVETSQTKRNALIGDTVKISRPDPPVIALHQPVIVGAAKQSVERARPTDKFFPH